MESPPDTHPAKRSYGSHLARFIRLLPWSFPASPKAQRAFVTTATSPAYDLPGESFRTASEQLNVL